MVYLDPECDDATAQAVGEKLSAMPGVTNVQFVSKQDVLNTYRNYMEDYSSLWDEFENDNPFKANYRVSLADLSQMAAMSQTFQNIPGVYSVAAPIEMPWSTIAVPSVPPQRLSATAIQRITSSRSFHPICATSPSDIPCP